MAVPLQQYFAAASRAIDRPAGVRSFTEIMPFISPILDTTRSASRWDFGFASFQLSAGQIVSVIFPDVPEGEFHTYHYLNLLINDPGQNHNVIVTGIPPTQQSPISSWVVVDANVDLNRGPNLLGLLDPAANTSNAQHIRPFLLPPGSALQIIEDGVLVAVGPTACGITWGREITAPPGLTELTEVEDAPAVQIT